MNCHQAKPLLEPYADGALEVAAILEVEEHLRTCSACALAYRNLQSLSKALQQEAVYFSAPDDLRERIKSALPAPAKAASGRPARTWAANWNWLTTAWSGATAVCLALLLVATLVRPSAQQQFAQEIVSSHIRSLMANHALDIVSTDQHTVKPWFDGKLDFAPPVKDLAAQGFPLLGGRLDYLGGRPVAALVYQRNKHVVNVFIWPAQERDEKPAAVASIQGYNLVHWSQTEMNLWAVSDLNTSELTAFAETFGKEQTVKH